VNFIQKRCLQSHEPPKAPGGHAPKSVQPAAARGRRRGGARRRRLTWAKAADRGVTLLGVARSAHRARPKAPGGRAPKSVASAAARARRRGGARRRRLTWVKAVVRGMALLGVARPARRASPKGARRACTQVNGACRGAHAASRRRAAASAHLGESRGPCGSTGVVAQLQTSLGAAHAAAARQQGGCGVP
jgi:hypothetical protein